MFCCAERCFKSALFSVCASLGVSRCLLISFFVYFSHPCYVDFLLLLLLLLLLCCCVVCLAGAAWCGVQTVELGPGQGERARGRRVPGPPHWLVRVPHHRYPVRRPEGQRRHHRLRVHLQRRRRCFRHCDRKTQLNVSRHATPCLMCADDG
jgi:hypothetical protein